MPRHEPQGVVSASGPGPLTRDGCAVELYALLEPRGEAELIHGALAPGASILELGCGTGRVTHGLVRLGHPVVAVDNSADMVARIEGAEAVLADIETLRLERRFGAVVLGSSLVNAPDQSRRGAFLATCREHVSTDGSVLIERMEPQWRDPQWASARMGRGTRGAVTSWIEDPRVGGQQFAGTMHYQSGGREWTHSFVSRILDDDEIEAQLGDARLRLVRYLDAARTWLHAGPV